MVQRPHRRHLRQPHHRLPILRCRQQHRSQPCLHRPCQRPLRHDYHRHRLLCRRHAGPRCPHPSVLPRLRACRRRVDRHGLRPLVRRNCPDHRLRRPRSYRPGFPATHLCTRSPLQLRHCHPRSSLHRRRADHLRRQTQPCRPRHSRRAMALRSAHRRPRPHRPRPAARPPHLPQAFPARRPRSRQQRLCQQELPRQPLQGLQAQILLCRPRQTRQPSPQSVLLVPAVEDQIPPFVRSTIVMTAKTMQLSRCTPT